MCCATILPASAHDLTIKYTDSQRVQTPVQTNMQSPRLKLLKKYIFGKNSVKSQHVLRRQVGAMCLAR